MDMCQAINQKDINEKVKIQKNLTQSYEFQLQNIQNEIDQYNFQEYEKYKQIDQGVMQITKKWDPAIFDKLISNQTQSDAFKRHKYKIFQKLMEKQFYLCQILVSNAKEDLILGFENDKYQNFDEFVFIIIYNPIQSEIDQKIQIIQSLEYEFNHVQIDEENIQILVIQKGTFFQIQKNIKLLVQFKQNILQIEEGCEINSTNYQECDICQDQKTCISYRCFKNVKSRILSFLLNKKYFYCEYQNKQIDGLIFQLNLEEFIQEYINFLYEAFFGFLKDIQIVEQTTSKQKLIDLRESNFKQKQISKNDIYQAQTCNIQLVNDYQFKDYLVRNYLDQNSLNITITYNKRQWQANIFNDINANQTSETFQKQQKEIIYILKNKKYFLCKSFIKNRIEDIFIGYQEEGQDKYQDYVFVIMFNPTHSELQKYFIIMQKFNDEMNYFNLNGFTYILILQKDVFLQIYNNFDYLAQTKIEWNKNYFEQVNKDKINQLSCNKCERCKQKQECKDFYFFRQFQVQKSEILDRLIAKNYFLCEYLSKGGEGLIFHGYRQSIQGKLDLVFKILFEYDDEDQIQIMKLLEIYIVKFVEFIKINKNVHVLILEKCQFSLQYELFHQLKTKKDFPLEKLLKMIFNLLDGLIQFRIYNILHLDIKPTNILFTNSGKYVYTDFGMSSLKKNNQQISIKGLTKSYASPEQLNNDLNIDYQSDIYSLGKTFEIILKVFQQVQQQNYLEIISQFIRIVDEKMILEKPTQRSNCHQILNEFFQYILKQNQCQSFLKQYLDEMKEILKLYPYDKNKEIPYFLEISLFYNLNILAIQKEFIKKDNQIDIQKMKQDIAVSLADVGKCYQNIGVNQKALEYQLKSLQMRKQIFKENHLEISVSLKDVGVCYQNLGLYKQALRYLLESLQMLKLKFKYNYPSISSALNDIGLCYQNLGDIQKAQQYQLKSLQKSKQILKENHPDSAIYLSNIGLYYQNIGFYQKALEYLQESLQMTKQIYKENHPQIAQQLNNVASCYFNFDNYQKALEYFQQSLLMTKQIFKENHPLIALYLNNIGSSYLNLNEIEKALGYLFESLKIYQQIYKEKHPGIASCLNNIGICYQILCDYKKAIEYFQQSLLMTKQIFKENHPLIALYLNNIGSSYLNLNESEKALGYLLESLKLYQQIYKEKHPGIASCLNNIGICYQTLYDYKNALEYSLESLKIWKQIFNKDHPNIPSSLINVGLCFYNFGDNSKALDYLLESLQMTKQLDKENHPYITKSLDKVGLCYKNLGDYKKVLEFKLESFQIRRQMFKQNYLIIAQSLNNIGLCYLNLGENKIALEYLLESIQITKQIQNQNH